jgi:cyclic beta-1,2-glucan synthetase
LLADYQNLAAQAEQFFTEMDFSFLYNIHRQVFHIGYNVSAGTLDDNYYDLLASEARLASLLAIAKRDVPQSHWLHLGRPVTKIGSDRILLSWSGTMFEYLMPSLLMKSYEQTFLTQSCQAAVAHQIAYGRSHSVPWGISESGFYAFGPNMDYQYHAFGVPGLGFKRGLADDLVFTPYASLMALRFDPQAVSQNIDMLDAIQMRGRYGFYEAVDYTHSRLMLRQDRALVYSYMAHHQGMILVSAANYLLDDIMLSRFHSDPRVKSVELLLQEKVPDQAPLEFPQLEPVIAARTIPTRVTIAPWQVSVESAVPQLHVLSNGSFSTLISAAGSGYSFWEGLALTRWQPDTTLDNWGQWIYIQDMDSGAVWSAAYQPTAVAADNQSVRFSPHQVEFQRSDNSIGLTLTITVAPTDDIEIRRITLINHSDHVRRLRVTSTAS